jgi:hypothetical protein
VINNKSLLITTLKIRCAKRLMVQGKSASPILKLSLQSGKEREE